MTDIYESANSAKASFESIYNRPDPRSYYKTLGALDYCIPSEARPVFLRVMKAIGGEKLNVVDVGCSYGVNAAMLRYDLEFVDLVSRYRNPAMKELSVAEAIRADAAYFAEADPVVEPTITGIDVADKAAGYARAVGLLDEAIIEDFESAGPSSAARGILAEADLVITTGAVGYVTEKTFSHILETAGGRPPWVAAFVLRQYPFEPIADRLKDYGLDTEKLEGRYFPQRRFKDEEEQTAAIEALGEIGVDPVGLEDEGGYFAEFFLAKPPGATSLRDLGL